MKICIVSGSQQMNSNSSKLAALFQTQLHSMKVDTSILNLAEYPSLLHHYGFETSDKPELADDKTQVLSQLYEADGFVIISPEWGGMLPPALTNLLLLSANGSANGFPMAHKPAFAVGVSASAGGSNPISLLKAYSAKNSHLVWLPCHLVVQNVESFLATGWQPSGNSRLEQVQSRMDVGIQTLITYSRQLQPVRESLTLLSQTHPYGQ